MKPRIITIGCDFGAGGPQIGKALAEALGIEYYDRDLVDKVVSEIDVDRKVVEEADTHACELRVSDKVRPALREPDEPRHLRAERGHPPHGRPGPVRDYRPQRELPVRRPR